MCFALAAVLPLGICFLLLVARFRARARLSCLVLCLLLDGLAVLLVFLFGSRARFFDCAKSGFGRIGRSRPRFFLCLIRRKSTFAAGIYLEIRPWSMHHEGSDGALRGWGGGIGLKEFWHFPGCWGRLGGILMLEGG